MEKPFLLVSVAEHVQLYYIKYQILIYSTVVKTEVSYYFYVHIILFSWFEYLSILANLSSLEMHKSHNWLVNALLETLHSFPLKSSKI